MPLEQIITNPWFSLSSFLIGVVGLFLTVYFYFKSKKRIRLVYATNSNHLIRKGQRFEKLEIRYDGQAYDRLTATALVFFNDGEIPIRASDVAREDPIRIKLNEGRIVDTKVAGANNPSCKIATRQVDEATLKVSFEYLNHKDGAVIYILHTGSSESLRMDGHVIGFGPIRRNLAIEVGPMLEIPMARPSLMRIISIVALMAFLIMVVMPIIRMPWSTLFGLPLVFFLLVVAAVFASIWFHLRGFPPRGLIRYWDPGPSFERPTSESISK